MTDPILKICGLTTLEQSIECFNLGAHWLGFNCYPRSKRYLPPDALIAISQKLPVQSVKVGVFVNETAEKVNALALAAKLDWVQLHGDETPEYCQKIQTPYFKAFRLSKNWNMDVLKKFPAHPFLVDAYDPHEYGGTGDCCDWQLANQLSTHGDLILAGGLTPNNIQQALNQVQPYGVDVCSGVESSPGVKDLDQVETFIQLIRNHKTTDSQSSIEGLS